MTLPRLLLAVVALLPALGAAVRAVQRWRRRSAQSPRSLPLQSSPLDALDSPPGGARVDAQAHWAPAPDMDEVMRRLYATAFDVELRAPGVARAGHVQNVQHDEVIAAAAAVLARIDSSPRYAPRRPHLLPQLMNAVNDKDASLRKIASIIAQDPALAGNLLRITNSAMYRVQSRPVESVQRAVTLVGTEGIRLIIAAALVQPVMNVGSGVLGRLPAILWDHSLMAARASADHASAGGDEDALAAQLLGLLHGLGSIIVVQVLRDEYAKRPELLVDPDVAVFMLNTWTAPTARCVAASWQLSTRIQAALGEQKMQAVAPAGSQLGAALRFGRMAGALVLLSRNGSIEEHEALRALAALDGGVASGAAWSRLNAASAHSP